MNHEVISRQATCLPAASNTMAAAPRDQAFMVEMDEAGEVIDLDLVAADPVESFFLDAGVFPLFGSIGSCNNVE